MVENNNHNNDNQDNNGTSSIIEMINEIVKKLTPKEKLAIIISMSALAVILITTVLLLALCGRTPADKQPDHTHEYNLALEYVDGRFNLIGKCNRVGCSNPDLKVEGVNATVDATKSGCSSKVYTYDFNGQIAECILIDPNGHHRLNGVDVTTLLNSDGSLNYDIPGVKKFSNVSYVCNGTTAGYFECDDCNEVVDVQVYRPHVPGAILEVVHPGCDTVGKTSVTCDNCKVVLGDGEDIPALGHAYKFELKTSGSTTDLVGKCTRKGCTDPDFLEKDISDLKLVEEIPSTSCASAGKKVYQYTNKDGKKVEITINDNNTKNHTLNGVDATTLMDKDGYYSYTTKGIRTFTGEPAPCGEVTPGMYTCEVCNQLVKIDITKPAHSVVISGTVNPTRAEAGYTFLKCKNDGCNMSLRIDLPKIEIGKNATVLVKPSVNTDEVVRYYTNDNPLGFMIELEITIPSKHDHVYSYTLVEEGEKNNLVGKCTVANCSEPDIVEENVTNIKLINEYPANCQEGKKSEYTCVTASGKTITFYVIEGEKVNGHYLHGTIAKGDVAVKVEINGEETIVNAFTYKGGKDGIKLFASSYNPGTTVSGYYECEHCKQLVNIYVYIPADYVD